MELKILGKTINGDPATAVPDALVAVAAGVEDAFGKQAVQEEKVEKLSKVINEELKPQLDALKEEQRALAREVPPPDDSDNPLKLGRLNLRMQVTEQEKQDKEIGGALAQLSKAQYSLMTQDIPSLGIENERSVTALKRFRLLNDVLMLAHLRFAGQPGQFPNYRGWESLPFADEYKALGKKFQGASVGMTDAAAGSGTEFVPVNILSGGIYDRIAIDLQVANALQTFPMVGPTVKRAAKGTRAKSYYTSETATGFDDATTGLNVDYPPDSVDVTFTAKKQVALAADSEEWDQDAIMNAAQYIMDELAYCIAYDKENAIVNGQLTGGYAAFDAGTTMTSTDMRLMVNGIRKLFALTGSTAQDLSAGVTAEYLAGIWASQGRYGSPRDGLWVVETSGLARLMTASAKDGSPMFLTAAAAGADAVNIKGVLGSIYGRPVILSDMIPTTMGLDGTVGTTAGAYTGIYHVNRRALMIGERKGVTVTMSPHVRFAFGQNAYRAVTRWDMQPMFAAASNKIIGAGLGVATY